MRALCAAGWSAVNEATAADASAWLGEASLLAAATAACDERLRSVCTRVMMGAGVAAGAE